MVAKYVLVPAKVQVATLDIVPSIAMWVSGPVGARAPSPAVVAPNTALVISLLLPNMVVEHVLVPANTQIATLAIAQLIALLVSGLVGPGAPSPAVVAPNTALVPLLLLPDMVAKHVLVPAKMQFATLAIVPSIAMLVNGPVGARAQSPVVVAPITALVPLSLPPVMVAKNVLTLAKMAIATLIIVQLIAMLVNGLVGVSAPSLAVVVLPTELVPSSLLPVMVARSVITPTKMAIATLIIVQLIAMLVSGPVGVSAPSLAEVAPLTALVKLSLLPVMVAKSVITPTKMAIATLIIVQLIVTWVNGVIGARAP
jgi:hypothetical protein